MAADFNAGSIEGTLDLDNSPFRAGLEYAKEQAKKFEDKKIEPRLGLDRTDFDVDRARTTEQLAELGARRAKPEVKVKGTAEALTEIGLVKRALNSLGKSNLSKFGQGGVLGSANKAVTGAAFSRIALMPAALLSVVAAAGPATSALLGFAGAGAVAFGGLVPSLLLFGGAVKSAFGEIAKANKDGKTLTGVAGEAQKALKSLTKGWHDLTASVRPQLFGFLTKTFQVANGVLGQLSPLLKTVTVGMTGVVTQIGKLTQSKLFEKFLGSLREFMGGFLKGLGPVLTNLLAAFMHAFIALSPIFSMIGQGIGLAARELNHFAKGLQAGGIDHFIANMKANLPLLGALIRGVFGGLKNIGESLAPLSGPALSFITQLVDAIGKLNLEPLAAGLGAVLAAAGPLLPVLGQLLNAFLGPIGKLLGNIADSAITPLAKGLGDELKPALSAISDILDTLSVPLTAFITSIADLANPTGVSFVSTALQSLSDIIKPLAGPVADLAVAFESFVDDGLEVLTAVLPTVTPALVGLAGGVGWLADVAAKLLKHKAVADTILGIVAAAKAYKAVMIGYAAITGIIEAVSLGWAGLTVAQDANTASVAANKAGQIAWKAVSLASAAASKAAAAAQWLWNGAVTGVKWLVQVGQLLAYKAAQAASAVATGVMTAAQWALNAAMDANPITLVVLAIAALAAGFIYAYKHSATFRKIVQAALHGIEVAAKWVFNWFKSHWKLLLAILTGPFGIAVYEIAHHWSAIKSGATSVKNWITDKFDAIVNFFKGVGSRISRVSSGMWDGIKNAFKGAINFIIDGWNSLHFKMPSVDTHIPGVGKIGGFTIGLPHINRLAKGGVTEGPMQAIIGDNPTGREAVVPLDKYDLPKKGETTKRDREQAQSNASMLAVLQQIAKHLADAADPSALAEAIGEVVGKHSDANLRRMTQIGRAM